MSSWQNKKENMSVGKIRPWLLPHFLKVFDLLLFMMRVLTFLVFFLGHANAQFNECNMTETETCALDSLSGPTKIFPGGDTACLNANRPYFFQVNPGTGDDANHVILHFQGGGGCTGVDCRTAVPFPIPVTTGIFNDDRQDNPFRNWTRVVILYCTGDLHIGNNVVTREEDGAVIRFHGRNNTKAALDWLYANLASPDRLLLTGCSAGSTGAQYWSHPILNAYTDTIASVVYDSLHGEPWVFDNANAGMVNGWSICSNTDYGWTLEQYEACRSFEWNVANVQNMTHAMHRDVPFCFGGFKWDPVMKQVYCGVDPESSCRQSDHYAAVKELLRSYIHDDPDTNNVVTYHLNGPRHCFIDANSVFDHDNGETINWLARLAYRDPSSTVITSQCVDAPWWDPSRWWGAFDFSCDTNLANAEFRP